MSLRALVERRVRAAFTAAGLPADHGRVAPSQRAGRGQFQCSGAMAASGPLGRPSRVTAELVAAKLVSDPVIGAVAVESPGFLNLTVRDDALASHADSLLRDERLGVHAKKAETIVLDCCGANIAKPMHVGHLRSSIIGDSLQRILRFAGDRVVSDAHLGDWGTHIGACIVQLRHEQPGLPWFDPAYQGPYPATSPVTIEELGALYQRAAAARKADPARHEEDRTATSELQSGRPGYRDLWRRFREVSTAAVARDLSTLGIAIDRWDGESSVHDMIAGMVEELRARGLAVEDDGAVVMPVATGDDASPVPPLILLKRDGAALYGTTDLATVIDRVRRDDSDRILYVVDQRQALHFEQVFRAARKAGLNGRASLEHIGFGTVNGRDGRPFRTREGGAMRLADLTAAAVGRARERLREAGLGDQLSDEERAQVAHQVALAAIKFADLSSPRASDYVFDLERFTAFEGKTGVYLQYAGVRARALLRRAGGDLALGPVLPPVDDAERALLLQLGMLPDAFWAAYEARAPDRLCDFAYALAQGFTRFYAACPVLGEADQARRASRLALVLLTLRELELVLGLLGIEVPDRM